MSIESRIKAYAKKIGIPLIGFAGVEPFLKERDYLLLRFKEGRYTPFEEQDLELRTDVTKLLSGAGSIISIALPYCGREQAEYDDKPRGIVACFSLMRDYHKVLRERMDLLVDFIRKMEPETEFRMFVDTGPLLDKAIAARAGLGWIGKNTLLVTEEYGSYVVLGEIITNLELKPDDPQENGCGNCERCVRACPTRALVSPYRIDPSRCISFLTQKRGDIPPAVREKMGRRIYGCDICQEVCPYNEMAKREPDSEFREHLVQARPPLLDILHMTKSEYRRTFGQTTASWIGQRTLKRNAIIALANSGDASGEVISKLKELRRDPNSEIRDYAGWALEKLSPESSPGGESA